MCKYKYIILAGAFIPSQRNILVGLHLLEKCFIQKLSWPYSSFEGQLEIFWMGTPLLTPDMEGAENFTSNSYLKLNIQIHFSQSSVYCPNHEIEPGCWKKNSFLKKMIWELSQLEWCSKEQKLFVIYYSNHSKMHPKIHSKHAESRNNNSFSFKCHTCGITGHTRSDCRKLRTFVNPEIIIIILHIKMVNSAVADVEEDKSLSFSILN